MCASTPQKTRTELQVKWTRGKSRKKERVPALCRQTGRDQELNPSFGLGQKVALNTLTLYQELHRSFSSSPGVQRYCTQPRASLRRDPLALSAVTTGPAGPTESRASSAALQVGPQHPRSSGCGNRQQRLGRTTRPSPLRLL